jgi:MFS family permease
MAGLADPTYVGACALLLGASAPAVALLMTVPVFLGACAQLIPSGLIERTGRRKPFIVGGALVQALAWLPMIASLWAPRAWGFALLFGGWIVYFATLHFTLPPWMSLMGDLVPAASRGRYFGRRSALAVLLQFLAMIVSGAGLAVYKEGRHELLGYTVVFAGAFAARLLSVYYLGRMGEPPYLHGEEDRFTLWQFLRRLPESNFARFVLFVAFLNGASHFAGCLFIPYWRDELHWSYWQLMAASSVLIAVQVPALPFWGRASDRFGNRKVLVVSSLGIALIPALWLSSTHVALALVFQMWSGFFWSGFNQSVGNFLLDAVSPPKRARCMAYLQFLVHCGLLLGGLAGAWAIKHVPRDIGGLPLPYAFWAVLGISFLLRGLTLAVFLPRFREVRSVPAGGVVDMLVHATRETAESAVTLMTGMVARNGEDPGKAVADGRVSGTGSAS